MGPLTFIIYINELPNVVVSCNVELYADDDLIYFTSKFVDDIQAHSVTADLRRINNWLQANYLILNLKKTKAMLVGTHQKIASAGALEIAITHKCLKLVEKFKFLGVLMDQTLSWKDHFDYIGNNISSRLGVLRRARKVLPKTTCLLLYNTLILPLFDYCSPVWDSCGAGSKAYIDKLRRRTASIIEGRTVCTEELRTVLS